MKVVFSETVTVREYFLHDSKSGKFILEVEWNPGKLQLKCINYMYQYQLISVSISDVSAIMLRPRRPRRQPSRPGPWKPRA